MGSMSTRHGDGAADLHSSIEERCCGVTGMVLQGHCLSVWHGYRDTHRMFGASQFWVVCTTRGSLLGLFLMHGFLFVQHDAQDMVLAGMGGVWVAFLHFIDNAYEAIRK
jgi:hypothetical protein